MTLGTPAPAALRSLDDDTWSQLVGHARRALRDLDGVDEPGWDQLRRRSTADLLSGAGRTELEVELATGGALWTAVAERLGEEDAGAWEQRLAPPEDGDRPEAADGAAEERARRRKQRLRELKEERDQARRQVTGAEARARTAEQRADELEAELDTARSRIDDLQQQLEDADAQREVALDRQRRQLDGEADNLREEVRALRRAEQERRTQEQRREEARAAAERAAQRTAEEASGGSSTDRGRGVRPGRPTRLPRDVQPGTSAAARVLLTAEHDVLIDGYNLTFAHRGHLDLEQQRAALIKTLEAAAARFPSDFAVLFDSRHGSPSGGARSRSVRVRFTAAGVTADDEIVFEVQAAPPDQPILVVTDDRELRDRVRAHGVDVLGTGEFLRAVE